jgi:hypothetical protein
MKALFYLGLLGLAAFEVLKVYFIMPMPGSQGIDSLGFAYFLHAYRWVFRAVFIAAIAVGSLRAEGRGRRWLAWLAVAAAAAVAWLFNFEMSADKIFLQPAKLTLKARAENTVEEGSLVLGIERGGEAKAYPIRYLVYHHQVQDSIGGLPVIVTYCSVCRTGRVYEPRVDGRLEKFRLVGMDHFNAMFEDASTHSWWRQESGEAVAGPRTGSVLPEVDASQVTLGEWFRLHPGSLVMQPDEASKEEYDANGRYERGLSTGDLTRTDRKSWRSKSWVIGIHLGSSSKAFDWNRLRLQRILNDQVGDVPVVLVVAADKKSYAAFERPSAATTFTLEGDVLHADGRSYDFSGRDLAEPGRTLRSVNAHQEFWHSWRTFHPDTLRDM